MREEPLPLAPIVAPLEPRPVVLDDGDGGERREAHRSFRNPGVEALERVQKKKVPLDEVGYVEGDLTADIPVPGCNKHQVAVLPAPLTSSTCTVEAVEPQERRAPQGERGALEPRLATEDTADRDTRVERAVVPPCSADQGIPVESEDDDPLHEGTVRSRTGRVRLIVRR
jgi:hypothetical protein